MLCKEDRAFLAGPFSQIEGWCYDEAAAITLHLQRFQLQHGWRAPNYEIGVFKGKYLSVLHRAGTLAGQRTTGIDIFGVEPRFSVQDILRNAIGPQENLTLIEKNSSQYTASDLLADVGGPASWISVDGDHHAPGVFTDLGLAEATLQPWGVVAIDDFLNCNAMGVTEATFRYLVGEKTRLRPFCYCANKLLCALEDYVDLYHAQVPVFCEQNQDFPMNNTFVQRTKIAGARWHTQELLGRSIWLIA